MKSENRIRQNAKEIRTGAFHRSMSKIGRLLKAGKSKSRLQSLVVLTLCVAVVCMLSFSVRLSGAESQKQVFASADPEDTVSENVTAVPSGVAGVITGISDTPAAKSKVDRLGTSFGKIMVGQRVSTVDPSTADLDISASLGIKVEDLDTTASTMAANPKLMSDTDYETLLRIVEAEAGSEDLKGRILVANVIMNRVKDEEFPDNVTEVVWERRSGVPQFSPTSDGSIGRVSISEDTKEAVKQVMEGVDYSEGALFFIQRDAADKHNITWFEKDLKKLFKYGVHEFYTYPERPDNQQTMEIKEKEE